MAQTPEGRIKAMIDKLLAEYKDIYVFKPVVGGFGRSTLDYIVCYRGMFISIEAKRPGGKPTGRQEKMMRDIDSAGGMTYVVDGPESLAVVKKYLDFFTRYS